MTTHPQSPLLKTQKSYRLQTFLLALGIAALIFLPFILLDGGYFIYYGDFNVQQIPFYKLAHEAVRSGDLSWSWYTDLGANFVGSYGFYLLFSPFFWLTLPFPTVLLPYLMAPLLILKTACAALTACLYLERFVRDRAYALLGALLYAFSGWMFFNIFFNHFHEVAVFFPLLLLGVEMLVQDGKKGVFALAVLVNAMVNYWFFAGEAVFAVLYVLVRMTDKSWGMRPGKFVRIALESVLGVGMSAVFMLPSVLAILGNPRTGTDELVSGWNIWLYWHEQRQPAIIQSLFFPPELPSMPNFLPDHGAKWSSLSGWLPLFGMTGVLAYFFQNKNTWLKKILALSLLFALVPGLNSLFVLLNGSYYARWFYMPVLLMALATAHALEDSPGNTRHFRRAIKWSLIITGAFVVISGLTPRLKEEQWSIGLADKPLLMWVYALVTILCLLLAAALMLYIRGPLRSPRVPVLGAVFRRTRKKIMGFLRAPQRFIPLAACSIALVSVAFGIFYMANGKNDRERSLSVINTAIRGRYELTLPEGPFARIDVYDGLDNLGMFWHLPTIQTFHSIVPPSIMEFYPSVGVKRDVGSRPEAEFSALRPLLSVRWLFVEQDKEEQHPMPGYELRDNQLGFNIYENTCYLPMGFGYTQFVTRSQLEVLPTKRRSNAMLRAIVLEDDDAAFHSDILEQLALEDNTHFSARDMERDVANRREQTAYYFSKDTRGFTARSNLAAETVLFFSVPLEAGWSAAVNGAPAEIIRVNVGFMGVRVPAGEAEIRFDYRTPGLPEGAGISGICLLIWALYILLAHRGKKGPDAPKSSPADTSYLTWEEFHRQYGDKQARALRLRQTLDQAARPRPAPKDELPEAFKFYVDDNTDI